MGQGCQCQIATRTAPRRASLCYWRVREVEAHHDAIKYLQSYRGYGRRAFEGTGSISRDGGIRTENSFEVNE